MDCRRRRDKEGERRDGVRRRAEERGMVDGAAQRHQRDVFVVVAVYIRVRAREGALSLPDILSGFEPTACDDDGIVYQVDGLQ